ncbi:MAG: hypothetical protein P4L56_16925 [Candidatus Sulfopaludibacter sp.]|nr:hypothetical protein [Candidatus Sulfopaludibacter sp.]
MKAEHILVLVLAGALVGAGLMKLVQKPQPATVAAVRPDLPSVPSPPPAHPVVTPPAPVAKTPDPAPPQTFETPSPAPPALPHAHAPRTTRQAMPRVQAFAAKPSPFPAPRQAPIVVQVPPAPAEALQSAPTAETPKAAPQSEAPSPIPLPPARVEPEPVTPAPSPQPPTVTLNAGMPIPVRLVDGLSSERNAPGDIFVATLDQELVADGFVIAERGARVEGRVISANRGNRTRGGAELVVQLTFLHTSDHQRVPIRTDGFQKQMEPNHSEDAGKIAAGAVIGAAIGAIAGGGKGAAVGAGVGGGAGTGDVLLTRKPATLPSETRLTFRLGVPVTLTERQ